MYSFPRIYALAINKDGFVADFVLDGAPVQMEYLRSSKDPVWNLVWNNIAPPKVVAFVWKAVHGRIQTRLELSKRNIVSPQAALCPLCSLESESVVHFLSCCWFAQPGLASQFLQFYLVFMVL
ncbi:hypothetical protein V6N13_092624 [Hibiscus sabdariffa]